MNAFNEGQKSRNKSVALVCPFLESEGRAGKQNLKPQHNTVIQSRSSKILALAKSLGPEKEDPMQMRLKKGRWYAAFSYKGKWQGTTLHAYKHQEKDAIKNLTRLYDSLERGENPTDLNRTFKNALSAYYEWCGSEGEKSESAIEDIKGRLEFKKSRGKKGPKKSKLLERFENLTIKEITKSVVKLYKVDREDQGAPKSTIEKELRIVKEVCQIFNPSFVLPSFKRWANRGKKVHATLSYSEVMQVAEKCLESSGKYGKQYKVIFLLMAYTGLDIGDVISLRSTQVTAKGFILKGRGKTADTDQQIAAYLWSGARKLLSSQIVDISGRYFNVPSNKSVTTAVLRAFRKAGIKGNSKALRHLASSILFNEGVPDPVIKKFIGHSANSDQTGVYLHVDLNKIERGFSGFEKEAAKHEKLIENGGA